MNKEITLWDITKVSQVLGLTKKAIEMRVYRGQIGVVHIGKRRMFDSNEIIELINKGREPAFNNSLEGGNA